MPIVTLTASSLEHICAGCGQTHRVRIDDVKLGVSVEAEQRTNKDVIRLPPCQDCGALEHLVRSWAPSDQVGAGGHQGEHRRVVNRLAAMLKAKGRVDKGCAEALAAETDEPPDIHPDTPKGRRGRIDIGPPSWAGTQAMATKAGGAHTT
jgi:hypothetical protein